jgi:hypothetical protein
VQNSDHLFLALQSVDHYGFDRLVGHPRFLLAILVSA